MQRETELRQFLVLYSAQFWVSGTIQLLAAAMEQIPGMQEWHRSLRDFSAQMTSLIIIAAAITNYHLCQVIVRRRE